MATWQFIELATHPDTIINVSQIVSIEKVETVLSEKKQKAYAVSGSPVVIIHALHISLVGGKNIELAFDSEARCVATLKMMKMALKPLLVIKPSLPGDAPSSPKKPRPFTPRRKPRNPDSGPSQEEKPLTDGGS